MSNVVRTLKTIQKPSIKYAEKQKGHSAFQIFQYLLCQVFCDRSMYMQIVTGRYEEEFSKNADRFGLTDDQLADFVRDFYDRLPVSYQRVLRLAA